MYLVFLSATIVKAQSATIAGTIGNDENLILPNAVIELYPIDDTLNVNYTTTDKTGNFIYRNIKYGKWNINITFIGYETKSITIEIKDDFTDLGYIAISPSTIFLSEVKIEGITTPVLQKGDTTQYNANSYKTKTDATTEELLMKMPGIGVQDGIVQVQGEDVKKVLVDGKPFFGEDPNVALRNIPSQIVDKIQVFDEQSEESKFSGFDDGNITKTINIIIKKEFREGKFGNAYSGYGYNDKYSVGGVVNVFSKDKRITVLAQTNNINKQNFSTNDLAGVISSISDTKKGRGNRGEKGGKPERGSSTGGNINDFLIGEEVGIVKTNAFGLNYLDKIGQKINLSGSYFFNKSNNSAETILDQEFFSNNSNNQNYNESNISNYNNSNHRVNLKLDFNINRYNSILITPKLIIQNNKGISNIDGKTAMLDSILNYTFITFDSDVNAFTFSNNILWRHRFEKRGRTLMFALNQEINKIYGESFLDSENYYYSSSELDSISQSANLKQYEQLYSARFLFTEPIANKANIIFSYIPTIGINNIDKKTYSFNFFDEKYNLLEKKLSINTESYLTSHKAGAGIRFKLNKSMFMFNLFYELSDFNTIQSLDNNKKLTKQYSSFQPMIMWRQKISRSKNIRAFYRTSIIIPSTQQLQEVFDNTNPLQLSIGNSDLTKEYRHNIFIKYSATNTANNTVLFAMLSGSYIRNYIANNTIIANNRTILSDSIVLEQGSQLTKLENLDRYYDVKALITYGRPINKFNFNLNTSVIFKQIPGIINNNLNYVKIPSLNIGMLLSSNNSEKIDFSLGTTSSIYYTYNDSNSSRNSKYLSQEVKLKLYYNFYKSFTIRTNVQYQFYKDIAVNNKTDFLLWNLSLGSKLFKTKNGEILITIFDILNQNKKIEIINTELYSQKSKSVSIGRYAILTFKYNFTQVSRP